MHRGVAVVITSFNQGDLIREAVNSVLQQSLAADELIVVDDGSTDEHSIETLAELERKGIAVLRQPNKGVSAARNAGIRATNSELTAVLDGDDRFRPGFLAAAVAAFDDDDIVAASSWLAMFGTVAGIVRPSGGSVTDFLARNSCPASSLFRRQRWHAAGGYAEDMREGFEDWDFFLRILSPGGRIHIVEEPLIEYRTHPQSANLAGMTRRLSLYSDIIDRHESIFTRHAKTALLAQETISIERLNAWERLVVADRSLDLGEATYGDGGMAAHVRIATQRAHL